MPNETDCFELLNSSLVHEPLRSTSGQIVTMQDIIGSNQTMNMLYILISSIIIFLYTLYVNFILGSRFDILAKYNIDIHELMILPASALLVISLAFFWSDLEND